MVRTVALLILLAPAAEAFPVPKPARTPNVVGTTWEGTTQWSSSRTTSKITFAEGGKLIYGRNANSNHTWKQNGATVTWSINNYSHYTATLTGNTLKGTATNKVNNSAVVKLTKLEEK